MEKNLKPLIEALIFVSEQPLSLNRIAALIEDTPREEIRNALKELVEDYQKEDRGLYLEEVAGGWQIRTRAEYAPWIKRHFVFVEKYQNKFSRWYDRVRRDAGH